MAGVEVRPARIADVPVLVRLRQANAEAHIALDPDVYRVPEAAIVARHFEAVIGGDDAVLVAEDAGGQVVGMIEVLRNPGPPEHQILRPYVSAQVHTVVLDEARGLGVGAALLRAAQRWAGERGIRYLSAGIHHRNAGAVRFYRRHGFSDSGMSLGRQL